jgi:DNA-binding NarL/FixJ family response regulator
MQLYPVIFIIENTTSVSESLQKNLKRYTIIHASNSNDAIEKLKRKPKPVIIIINTMIKPEGGIQVYSMITKKRKYNNIPIIFISSKYDEDEKRKCLKLGAIDYMSAPFNTQELILKIKAIIKLLKAHKKIVRDDLTKAILTNEDYTFIMFEKRCKEYNITPREKEVIRKIFDGLEVKEIANKLFVSTHTIRNHVRRIYKKCKVQNRVELLNIFKE